MFKRIDHIEIIPRDLDETINFYCDILGFKVKSRNKVGMLPLKEVVYIELGDTMVELMSVENPPDSPTNEWQMGYRLMALEVTDMDEAVNYLKSKNVPITWGPVDMGTTKRAEFKDPNGLSVELRQW